MYGMFRVEFDDDELKRVIGDAEKALQTLSDCVAKLQDMGIMTIKKAASSS